MCWFVIPVKVVLYSDPFARKTPFGTGRYARHLLSEMRRLEPGSIFTPWSTWTDCDEVGQSLLRKNYGWRKIPFNRKLTASAWAFLKAPPFEFWGGRAHDLVHLGECVYPVCTKKPLVVTIHDIGPLTHPDLFTSVRPWLMKMGLRQAIKEAAAIIAVSQSTADIFQDYFQVDLQDRIQVVHEGVNAKYLAEADEGCLKGINDLPPEGKPFLLTMGAISPRKNLSMVLEALEQLSDKIPHHLVHVGIPLGDADDFFAKLQSSRIADRIHLPGYLSDHQVHALYGKAHAYIYPSLFEGFGLPLLEAMAGGCPIITADIASMPEIAGDAAILIDPRSVCEMTDAIFSVCSDDSLAESLRRKGQERVRQFSWERCARKTLALYRKVLG